MDIVTLLVDLVIALWFLAVVVAIVRAWQARTPQLVTLSPEARTHFVRSWHQIAAGFVDAPLEAVQQADALILSLLRERGRPVDHERLPKPIRDARRSIDRSGAHGTEALRQAMLHYRSIFSDSIGRRQPEPEAQQRTGKREMA